MGWRQGSSGNVRSNYSPVGARAAESSAWTAHGVRYRDVATADPPNSTISRLPPRAVIVWAVIYSPASHADAVHLDVSKARHLPCCEAASVIGGVDELTGTGGGGSYNVIVRIYYGSRPSPALRREAQAALERLRLPAAR